MAYIAYHFKWSHEEVMGLDHRERQLWVDEIAKINTRLSEEVKAEMEKYGG